MAADEVGEEDVEEACKDEEEEGVVTVVDTESDGGVGMKTKSENMTEEHSGTVYVGIRSSLQDYYRSPASIACVCSLWLPYAFVEDILKSIHFLPT